MSVAFPESVTIAECRLRGINKRRHRRRGESAQLTPSASIAASDAAIAAQQAGRVFLAPGVRRSTGDCVAAASETWTAAAALGSATHSTAGGAADGDRAAFSGRSSCFPPAFSAEINGGGAALTGRWRAESGATRRRANSTAPGVPHAANPIDAGAAAVLRQTAQCEGNAFAPDQTLH